MFEIIIVDINGNIIVKHAYTENDALREADEMFEDFSIISIDICDNSDKFHTELIKTFRRF